MLGYYKQILIGIMLFFGAFNVSVLGAHRMPESPEGPFPVELAVFIVDVDDIDGAMLRCSVKPGKFRCSITTSFRFPSSRKQSNGL